MNLDIYYINLASREDRLANIVGELEKASLHGVRIDAVDGRIKPPEDYVHYDRAKRLKYYDDLVGGEIGCSESHFLALDTYLREGKADFCLVLEDDAILPENFKSSVETLVNYRSGWDLIRLQRSRKQKGVVVDTIDGHEILFPYMVGLKTSALLYTRKGAEKTRELYSKFIFPADHVLKFGHLYGIWTFETNPTYVDQNRDEKGDIDTQQKPFKEKISFYNKAVMLAYRILGQRIRILLMPFAYIRWKNRN